MIYKKFDYTDINKDTKHLITLRSVSVRTGISTIDITNRITGGHIINRLSIEMYDETSSEYDDCILLEFEGEDELNFVGKIKHKDKTSSTTIYSKFVEMYQDAMEKYMIKELQYKYFFDKREITIIVE